MLGLSGVGKEASIDEADQPGLPGAQAWGRLGSALAQPGPRGDETNIGTLRGDIRTSVPMVLQKLSCAVPAS